MRRKVCEKNHTSRPPGREAVLHHAQDEGSQGTLAKFWIRSKFWIEHREQFA